MCRWLRLPIGLGLVIVLSGCQGLNQRQRSWLAEGERAYAQKRYSAAVECLTVFLADVKGRPEIARALYVRGMSKALVGRRPQAYADLEKAARLGCDPEITWRAYAVLGVLYFEDQNWTAGAQAFTHAVEKMPTVAPMDALLYRLGLCYERAGRWGEALVPYRRIVSVFPRGAYADRAGRRLQLQADHFAVQAGVFSQPAGAERLVEELRGGNLPAYVRRETRNNQLYHIVLVGRYDSYQQANQMLARVRGHIPAAQLYP
ncbi:MAG: SPOR domain-containing protein [Phycisphaerae bacterium]|nr:SPOR domain-containing protein [Phycisphaerae bacterium]